MRLKLFGAIFGLMMFAAIAAPLAGGVGTAEACVPGPTNPALCVANGNHLDLPLAANHGVHTAADHSSSAVVHFQPITSGQD